MCVKLGKVSTIVRFFKMFPESVVALLRYESSKTSPIILGRERM